MPEKHCLNNVWIVKPVGQNCGRGIIVNFRIKIKISQELQKIYNYMKQNSKGSSYK